LTVPLTVGELPRDKATLASLNYRAGKNQNRLGISVEDLNAEQRKQLGVKDQGVVITDLNGAARRSALQPGDVVLMVNRKQVKDGAGVRQRRQGRQGRRFGDAAGQARRCHAVRCNRGTETQGPRLIAVTGSS
jgi:PDZ domain (Also known as DHR or GLGF).